MRLSEETNTRKDFKDPLKKTKETFEDNLKELRLLGALTQSSSTTTSVSIDYFFTLYSIFYVLYFINPVKFYYDISEY